MHYWYTQIIPDRGLLNELRLLLYYIFQDDQLDQQWHFLAT